MCEKKDGRPTNRTNGSESDPPLPRDATTRRAYSGGQAHTNAWIDRQTYRQTDTAIHSRDNDARATHRKWYMSVHTRPIVFVTSPIRSWNSMKMKSRMMFKTMLIEFKSL